MAYPVLVWAMREYGSGMATAEQMAELERYELAVKAAVEVLRSHANSLSYEPM